MFNSSARKKAVRKLKYAVIRHESVRKSVARACEMLFAQRQRGSEVIASVEKYVNQLANSPKEFKRTIAEVRVEADRFMGAVKRFEAEPARDVKVGGSTGAAGVAAGAGVAAFAPSAAMAIATTFGTASTGTAISALSGAAATNAALAWLGGGAIAAGGGGMAGGSALLALAGPVGWTVGGAALLGSGIYLNSRNKKHAEEATKKRIEVRAQTQSLRATEHEIEKLHGLTKTHVEGCLDDLRYLKSAPCAPNDYRQFSEERKLRLAALINNVRSLGALLNKEVSP